MTLTKEITTEVIAALHEAGSRLQRRPAPRPARTTAEFRATFDTIDSEITARLRPVLERLRPGAEWAEEMDPRLGENEQWVVDTIDGAIQYLHGLPQWCLSATLVRSAEPLLAVLHNPVLGETYAATAGGGASRNGLPIHPSATTELAAPPVAPSQPPFAAADPESVAAAGRSLSSVLMCAGAVRNLGPTSWQIADVAAGRLDAFWEYGLDDANLIGASLIAREAGATVTDANGVAWKPGARSFLAAPPQLHQPFLKAIG